MTEIPARYDLAPNVIAFPARQVPLMVDGDETLATYGPPAQQAGLSRSASIVRFPTELPPMICRRKDVDP